MLLLRNVTYINSDADTTKTNKSISQGYLQGRDFTMVASSKTEMEHVEKMITKEEQCAFSLQTGILLET